MVAQTHSDRMQKLTSKHLDRIKEDIQSWEDCWSENNTNFYKNKKFLFVSNLTTEDISILDALKKPSIEFNILEAFVSRLLGEFAKQTPSINSSSTHGSKAEVETDEDKAAQDAMSATLALVTGHFRYIEKKGRDEGSSYDVFRDQLSAGFGVFKVRTEYKNEMSFDQDIIVESHYDPTMCGFDPTAKRACKEDGRFCYEKYLKTREELENDPEFEGINFDSLGYDRKGKGLDWSFKTSEDKEMLYVVHYYEKEKKSKMLYQLSNGRSMYESDYRKLEKEINDSGAPIIAPTIKNRRKSQKTVISRYTLIEDKIVECIETDYSHLNLVFVDGNSTPIKDSSDGILKQIIRPYFHQARGAQMLKNFAGQTLANDIENMVQHKFKVAEEGIPSENRKAYTDTQVPNVLLYKSIWDEDPTVRIPAPEEIHRIPTPPEVLAAFGDTDRMIQSILGTYDTSMNSSDRELSGVAMMRGGINANAAVMPFIVNFLKAYNQVAQIVVDLIPKYFVTPRSIPVINEDGIKSYKIINQQSGAGNQPGQTFDYTKGDLEISVSPGLNFQLQKEKNINLITTAMNASELFKAFMNKKGLKILTDNLDISDREQVNKLIDEFQAEQKDAEEKQAHQGQQNPLVMRVQNERIKIAQEAKQNQVDNPLKAGQLALDQDKVEISKLEAYSDISNSQRDAALTSEKLATERSGQAVEVALKTADLAHKHAKNYAEAKSKKTDDN